MGAPSFIQHWAGVWQPHRASTIPPSTRTGSKSVSQNFVDRQLCEHPGRDYILPPPRPPFLPKRHFPSEGGGGVYFEPPRGRNFIRAPPFYTYTPPTPRRVFCRGGGVGVYKIRPRRTSRFHLEDQEPRRRGFSKGGFCRVECHAQGNRKYPRILGSAVNLALRAPQPREAHILQKKPF